MGAPQDLGWTMFLVLAVTAACWLFIVVVASGAARLSHAHDTTAKASVRALPVRHYGGRSAA